MAEIRTFFYDGEHNPRVTVFAHPHLEGISMTYEATDSGNAVLWPTLYRDGFRGGDGISSAYIPEGATIELYD